MTRPPNEEPPRPGGVYARLAEQAEIEHATLTPPRGTRLAGWIIVLAIAGSVIGAAIEARPW